MSVRPTKQPARIPLCRCCANELNAAVAPSGSTKYCWDGARVREGVCEGVCESMCEGVCESVCEGVCEGV